MSINGIWTSEIYGPYGWENSGVYTLEDGRILGGSSRHYSAGKYRVSEDKYEADVEVQYYGPPRTIFGETRELFQIRVKGIIDDGVIDGEIVSSDQHGSAVIYRMTKRMDIPKI